MISATYKLKMDASIHVILLWCKATFNWCLVGFNNRSHEI